MKTLNAIMSAYAAIQFFKSAVDCGLRSKGNSDYALLRLRSELGQSGHVKESIQIEKANTLMCEASYFGAKVGSATVEFLQGSTADFDLAVEGAIGDIAIEIGRIMSKEQREKCIRFYEALNEGEGSTNEKAV